MASKRNDQMSVTIGLKDNTVDSVLEAQKLLSAPGSSTLTVNQNGPTYNAAGEVDEDYSPFNATFSWTEEK